MSDNFWADAPVIFSYTRAQAIEDGVLVDLVAVGQVVKDGVVIRDAVKEAGFKYPVACTSRVFDECIDLTPAAIRACNDIQGRLWDVLWMLAQSAKRCSGDTLLYQLHVVRERIVPTPTTLKCVIGPGDTAAPVMTIMFPDED